MTPVLTTTSQVVSHEVSRTMPTTSSVSPLQSGKVTQAPSKKALQYHPSTPVAGREQLSWQKMLEDFTHH